MSSLPEGYSRINPTMCVADVDKTIAKLESALGFVLCEEPMKNDTGINAHAHLRFEDASIMVGLHDEVNPDCAKTPKELGIVAPTTLYIYTDDVDALHARAVAAGMESHAAPEDMYWGDRVCILIDDDGYNYTFAKAIK